MLQVIVMLGKIFIIAVVTGLAYAWLTYAFTGIVSTIVFPTILTGLVRFRILIYAFLLMHWNSSSDLPFVRAAGMVYFDRFLARV